MKPFYLPDRSGSLFCMYFPPITGEIKRAIVHVPAFAEEMNKSRRMVALQSRAFADMDYAVLALDLYGTGDSSGNFGEATWEIWLENIKTGVEWLKQQGAELTALWGLRTGALLAMDFARRHDGLIEHLIAWQPVLNGDVFVTQFLRLRVAAAMMNSAMPQEKTADLKKLLQGGQTLEVAGYELNPDVMRALMALRADRLDLQVLKTMRIFELVVGEESSPSMANQQFLEKLNLLGVQSSLTTVVGESFWASQEIIEVHQLLKRTTMSIDIDRI